MHSEEKPTAVSDDSTSKLNATLLKLYATGTTFETWSQREPRLFPFELELLARYCPRKDISILTVGCGNGRETFGIYDAGFHNVCGIDFTPELLAVAEQRSRDLKLGIPFYTATADRLPFPDGSFDVITMFTNIYGQTTPKSARLAAITEAKRALKTGGLLLMDTVSLYHEFRHRVWFGVAEFLRIFHNPACLGRGDKLMRQSQEMTGPASELPRSHWFRPGEVNAEAEEAGFEVVQATTARGIFENPSANATTYRGKWQLLFVLRKNAEATVACGPKTT